jgi:hypothetical protein
MKHADAGKGQRIIVRGRIVEVGRRMCLVYICGIGNVLLEARYLADADLAELRRESR